MKVKLKENLFHKSGKPVCDFAIKTMQDSIPIRNVHEKNNLIECCPGCFSRTYRLKEINFQTATEEEQDLIMTKYRSILNSFGSNMELSLTILNRSINMEQFCQEVLLKETGDAYDPLRNELNKILLDRISEGKNGLRKDKYLTVAIRADELKKADEVFSRRLDDKLNNDFQSVGSAAQPLHIEERLEVIYDMYNIFSESPFLNKTKLPDETGRIEDVLGFDFDNLRSMGLSVNDVVGPSSIIYRKDYMELGRCYARVFQLPPDGLSTELSNEFLTHVTDMPFNLAATLHIKPIPAAEIRKIVGENLALVRQQKHKLQVSARNNNVSEDMIDPNILDREEECLKMWAEITENNEKLFETSLTVVLYAESMEKLEEYTDAFLSECRRENVTMTKMVMQQEEGFASTLPLGFDRLRLKRTLTSSALAVFVPFSNLEIRETSGINYTMNALSRGLIIYDRKSKANFNGFILGSSGSGKSFTAKTEMLFSFLGSDDDIMIIDPEREYLAITEALGGQIIELRPGGENYINPLDIDFRYELDGMEDSGNPVLEKASFLMKLFEAMLGEVWGMDSIQKTLIDRCLLELYKPYMQNGRLIRSIPKEQAPTLNDMMERFASYEEPEARKLYYTLMRFAGNGTLNIFSHHTNVEIRNRIVCFDISAIGEELKLMGMNIIQDALWSRLLQNRRIGRFTRIYVDECHLFFQPGNESAAEFLVALWKRARKYNGMPCGITQNVEDMIEHPIAKKLLSECNFIEVLAQSASARAALKEILHLSEASMEYITNIVPGQGLFYTGASTVPFYCRFPKNNEIYPLLTSNATEIMEYREIKKQKLTE